MSRTTIQLSIVLAILVLGGGSTLWVLSDGQTEDSEPATENDIAVVGVVFVLPTEYAQLGASLLLDPLKQAMNEFGYIEGDNIRYELAVPATPEERDAAIQDLLERDIDVFYVNSPAEVSTIRALSAEQPIVFAFNEAATTDEIQDELRSTDPQITGIVVPFFHERRFELLMQLVPDAQHVYAPYDPENPESMSIIEAVQPLATNVYGITFTPAAFTNSTEAQAVLDDVPADVDALFLHTEPEILFTIQQWGTLAVERRIPISISVSLQLPDAVMTYATDRTENTAILARLIAGILDGTPIRDLPPEPLDPILTVSLPAAELLGIEVQPSLLRQATVILREDDFVALAPSTPFIGTESARTDSDFCNATLVSILGEDTVCVTQSCQTLDNTSLVTFTQRTSSATCATEDIVGTCITPEYDTIFYSGDPASLETGCALSGGTWSTP